LVTVNATTDVAEATPVPDAVTVIGVVAATALLLAVTVSVPVDTPVARVVRSNDTTTPAGTPLAAIVTAPVKLPRFTVTGIDAIAERTTVMLLPVETEIVDVGAVMDNENVVLAVVTPVPLAVMTIGVVSASAALVAVKVTVLVVVPEASVPGSKDTTTPDGVPVAARMTGPVKLPPRAMVICVDVVAGRNTVAALTLAAIPMVGVGAGVGVSPDPPHATNIESSTIDRASLHIVMRGSKG